MSVTYPKGFLTWAVKAGIKPSGKPDLTLIVREPERSHSSSVRAVAGVASVFTRNSVVGAPVVVGKELRASTLAGGKVARAILINAGNSNAATGKPGIEHARRTMQAVAKLISCDANQVIPSSTGVIGRVLPVEKIEHALPALVEKLSSGQLADEAAAAAIMTTDLVPKTARAEIMLDGVACRLGAICKGSGMIAPKLDSAKGPPTPSATMLAFVTTDASIGSLALQAALELCTNSSFDRISVDNHPSCSDTVVCLASGAAGTKEITQGSPAFELFVEALRKVCTDLATQIVTDGEGATRIFKVSVSGAQSDVDAEKMCREVINSPLVKCAIHGRDPNWGRIVTAAGNAGVWFDTNESSLTIGPVTVYRGGLPVMEALKDPRLAEVMGARAVECELVVGRGPGKWWMIGCDLSAAYVSINADYTT